MDIEHDFICFKRLDGKLWQRIHVCITYEFKGPKKVNESYWGWSRVCVEAFRVR